MLACSGYLLTMLGDCVILYVVGRGSGHGGSSETKVAEEGQPVIGRITTPILVRTSSLSDTILLILALCFHSVFEGIAVGLQKQKHGETYGQSLSTRFLQPLQWESLF